MGLASLGKLLSLALGREGTVLLRGFLAVPQACTGPCPQPLCCPSQDAATLSRRLLGLPQA